ncbi:malto-oligosyltrehalose trehalohydrolase [Microvirga sp. 2TAF3]|uniref:malto-oligosyltrehalose trehalohydrolase n=1 Tax=Microvirga sp. 2TAF3 TaxID=3233014 RepID=UPI003F9E51B4
MRRFHRMPFGAETTPEGIHFALWAPTARDIHLVLDGTESPMERDGNGWYRLTAPEARPGSRYSYRVDGALTVPDPASRFQPDNVHGQSLVIDPKAYAWSDSDWAGRPWEETVLYEVHVGTATPEGTYAGLVGRLEAFRNLGITAIELMPLGAFAGRRNWGYDGVLPFAPAAAYGSPEDLKQLVESAHELGLMIFLDVVYNHFGPSGNYLHAYAEPFFTDRHRTPWGAGINVDGDGSRTVRDFFIHNALYWLEEYHFDGLRFDAVHAIADDSRPHFIEELSTRIRDTFPGREIHLVLENEANEARWLGRDAAGHPRLHTAQWADDIHNAWHALLTGEREGYYADYAEKPVVHLSRALAEGFAYQGEPSEHAGGKPRGEPSSHLPPTAFVSFLQNHDQIGNRAFGERLSHLVQPARLSLARSLHLLAPQVPLLFMGEEWAASTPFLYFVDFESEPDLGQAVREGRRGEFARFEAFADPETSLRIPDPTDCSTFMRSKLDWAEIGGSPHRNALSETRRLLSLRRMEIIPLLKSELHGAHRAPPSASMIDVTWSFTTGQLRLVANFGDTVSVRKSDAAARVVWSSPGVTLNGENLTLPSWTGAILKGPPI